MSLSVCPPNYEHKGGIASLLPLPFVTIFTPGRWLHRPIAHYLDRRPAPIISGQAVTRCKITVIPVASSAAVLLLLLIFPFVLLQPLSLSLPHQLPILYNFCRPRSSRLSFLFHSSIFHFLFDILLFAHLPS